MNTSTKVGEIFSKAGDSYNKIGDMIIMLAPAAQELIALDEEQALHYGQQQQQTIQLVNPQQATQGGQQQQVITLTPEQAAAAGINIAHIAQQQQPGTNINYEIAAAQPAPLSHQQTTANVKYVLANQSGTMPQQGITLIIT